MMIEWVSLGAVAGLIAWGYFNLLQWKKWQVRFEGLSHTYERDLDQWDKTEQRLVDRIVSVDAEFKQYRDSAYREREQLMSYIVTMRTEHGMSGGHSEQFDEPESYAMTDSEELAELQRRQIATEGTDEELLAIVRSKLADEIEEFEEPEVM